MPKTTTPLYLRQAARRFSKKHGCDSPSAVIARGLSTPEAWCDLLEQFRDRARAQAFAKHPGLN